MQIKAISNFKMTNFIKFMEKTSEAYQMVPLILETLILSQASWDRLDNQQHLGKKMQIHFCLLTSSGNGILWANTWHVSSIKLPSQMKNQFVVARDYVIQTEGNIRNGAYLNKISNGPDLLLLYLIYIT
ncbi:hypothetical protein ACJX0J_038595 [Zea mays]